MSFLSSGGCAPWLVEQAHQGRFERLRKGEIEMTRSQLIALVVAIGAAAFMADALVAQEAAAQPPVAVFYCLTRSCECGKYMVTFLRILSNTYPVLFPAVLSAAGDIEGTASCLLLPGAKFTA